MLVTKTKLRLSSLVAFIVLDLLAMPQRRLPVPPDELSVVVRLLGQQLDFPPVQELVQRGKGILRDGAFVSVTPHLQAHQGHTDVQGPVELKVTAECVVRSGWSFSKSPFEINQHSV